LLPRGVGIPVPGRHEKNIPAKQPFTNNGVDIESPLCGTTY